MPPIKERKPGDVDFIRTTWFQFAVAFSLQLEVTLRRPHLDHSPTGPIAQWTWRRVGRAVGTSGQRTDLPKAETCPWTAVGRAGAPSVETLPRLGQ